MRTQIPYSSLLTRDAILLLEADPDVMTFAARSSFFEWSAGFTPYRRKIPFEFKHRCRGKILLDVPQPPEGKKAAASGHINEKERHDHIERQAKANGFTGYESWNEAKIRNGHRLKNAELIVSRQACDLNEDHEVVIRFVMRQAGGTMPLANIRAALHDNAIGTKRCHAVAENTPSSEIGCHARGHLRWYRRSRKDRVRQARPPSNLHKKR